MSRTLNIIGCGNLGRTLAKLWSGKRTLLIGDVMNRSPESSADAVAFVGAGRAAASIGGMQPANLWLIGTPDTQLRAACESLAASGALKPGAIVFHCSGALNASELESATALGAVTGSVHPVASFANPHTMLAKFAGTCCCVEGELRARAILAAAFDAIGGRVLQIDGASKIVYHAGAVFASNYLVALLEVAIQALGEAGIPRVAALSLLRPLVEGSVENVFTLGTASALTGPIARGDMDLVKKQRAALEEWQPEVAELYRQLALAAARLAGRELKF